VYNNALNHTNICWIILTRAA